MAVFYVMPFSANEVVYLNKNISVSDLIALVSNNGTYARYGYTDNSNKVISLLGTEYSDYRVSSLPYSANYFTFSNGIYFEGVVFVNDTNADRRIVVSLDFPFSLYFDDFSLKFYFLSYNNNVSNVYSSFALSSGDIITLNTSTNLVLSGALNYLRSQTNYIDTSYYNYVLNNKYYTSSNGSNTYFSAGLTNNTTFYLYEVTISSSNFDKTLIDGIYFSYTLSMEGSNIAPRIFPYVYFANGLEAYILSSQDEVYTETLNNQRQIIAQQEQIINQLEEMNGPPSQQQQQEIDNIETELATEMDNLQEQIDIIHTPEWPTELPTQDTSNMEDVSQQIDTALGDLSVLNIFNVIVPAGCIGFLIYVVLRRF